MRQTLFALQLGLLLAMSAFWAAPPARAAGLEFTTSTVITGAGTCTVMRLGDLDGDHDLDLLYNDFGGRIMWYEETGANPLTFATHVIATGLSQPKDIWIDDLDGDTRPDFLSAVIGSDTVAWYRNSGATPPAFTPQTITNTVDGVYSVCAGDLNGDGHIDAIAAGNTGLNMAWYQNNGAATPLFTERYIAPYPGGVMALDAADFDRDGDKDILTCSYWMKEVAWIENRGGTPTTFAYHKIDANLLNCQFAATADLDGDGDLDAVSVASHTPLAAWYENNGAVPPVFTRHDITFGIESFIHMACADMDRDGDVDLLLTTNGTNGNFYYLENNGARPPVFTPRVLASKMSDAASPVVADFNQDGLQDVLVAIGGKVLLFSQISLPEITVQPRSRTITPGQMVTFTVNATGYGTLHYQWWKEGTKLANGGRIIGATAPSLSIMPTATADAGRYTCVVSNDYGQKVSQPAYLIFLGSGRIVAAPASLSYLKGTAWAVDVVNGGAPTTHSLNLTNIGELPVAFTGGGPATPGMRLTGPAAASFRIADVSPSTSAPLAPGETVTVIIEFDPVPTVPTLGLAASLEVTTDSPSIPLVTVPLTGDAVPVGLSAFTAN